MIDPELVTALVDASAKVQAAHSVAKRLGHTEVALRLRDAGMRIMSALAAVARDRRGEIETEVVS
jgi:hypothetical protein